VKEKRGNSNKMNKKYLLDKFFWSFLDAKKIKLGIFLTSEKKP